MASWKESLEQYRACIPQGAHIDPMTITTDGRFAVFAKSEGYRVYNGKDNHVNVGTPEEVEAKLSEWGVSALEGWN